VAVLIEQKPSDVALMRRDVASSWPRWLLGWRPDYLAGVPILT